MTTNFLTVSQVADKIGFTYKTTLMFLSRSEFAKYRTDDTRPLKILWSTETQDMINNLLKMRGYKC